MSDPQYRPRHLLAPIAHSYARRLRQYGAGPKGVFWKNGDTQALRFQVLLGILDGADLGGGISIADFGCGYGALFEAIRDEPFMNGSRYVGYDMTKTMVETAAVRLADPRVSFRHAVAVTEPADYVLVSGTYNLKNAADDREWEAYIRASLVQLWSMTGKGLAFNLLTSRAAERESGLFYADAARFFDFCTKILGPRVTMVAETPRGETTFKIRR
ncbi:MAG: hypothetical protein ACPGNT_11820 [Rhodospirillales bacterium]